MTCSTTSRRVLAVAFEAYCRIIDERRDATALSGIIVPEHRAKYADLLDGLA
ncbi:hypothetical protein [Halomonas sp. MA07-2]|uniref:hypothetical protein n=1 Tax=Halomonas sp. MA07-2 TaxID=3440841 RepID=UPI003F497A60